MNPNPRRLAVATATLALVFAGCGPTGADGSDGSDSSGSSDDGASDGETAGSPLDQLFGSMGDSQRFVEDGIASCMRERGWEYEPNTAGLVMVATAGPGRDPAFAEQYGYGISTRPPIDEMFGGATTEMPDDPNGDYVDSLSDADRDRYFTDLTGAAPMASEEVSGGASAVMIESEGIDPNTCFAQAQQAAAQEHPELSEAFGERLGELMQGIDRDPAMTDAMAAWSACMAAADYPYESQREIYSDLSQRYSQITGDDRPAPGGAADENMVVVGGGAMLDGEELDLSPADEERLAKLQADEIAIARTDLLCADEHLDEVRRVLEQDVADVLRSEYPGLGAGE
jgi:hypothetical protein